MADLTREEIERMLETAYRRLGGIRALARSDSGASKIVDIAAREVMAVLPTRLAQARADGVREGVEAVAAALRREIPTGDGSTRSLTWSEALDAVDAIRALTPPPAEPRFERLSNDERAVVPEGYAAPIDTRTTRELIAERTAPQPTSMSAEQIVAVLGDPLGCVEIEPAEPAQPDDGWIEWKGGECPVPDGIEVEVKYGDGVICRTNQPAGQDGWGWQSGRCLAWACIIAYRIVKPAEPSAPVAEPGDWTVSDTELARDILCYLGIGSDASLEPGDRRRDRIAAMICADRERRALLQGQGGGDAEAV